jgi:hypothetical protein
MDLGKFCNSVATGVDESQDEGGVSILKNSKHEKFATLVARGKSAREAYVLAGYKKKGAEPNSSRLIRNDKIVVRISEIQSVISEKLINQSIAVKEARIRAVNERWLKMQQVIAERAVDISMKGVAGGSTGLLAHDQKGVGSGPAAEVIDVYEVDTGLLKELREHEVQAAKEMGQWIEKGELGGLGGGPLKFGLNVIIESDSKSPASSEAGNCIPK